MKSIYIAVKESGSYSDYSKTNIRAFYNEHDAEIFIKAKNDEIILFKKASSQQYTHMNEWLKEDKKRDYRSYSSYNAWYEIQTIAKQSGVNRYAPIIKQQLSPEKVARIEELEIIVATMKSKMKEHFHLYQAEEKDFIRSLDFLDEEQKERFIESRYRDTDSNYLIETIEIG